jgi:hypothetical protein
MMRSVVVGLVVVAVLVGGGCSDNDSVEVKLSWKTTDAQLAEKLKEIPEVGNLNLSRTKVTDAGLVYLKGLEKLKKLRLNFTRITDAGLVHLAGLSNLKQLGLQRTRVTDAGIKKLQKALPDCTIKH